MKLSQHKTAFKKHKSDIPMNVTVIMYRYFTTS